MSRSSPYPAPGRLRHGTSQQDITLGDVLKAHDDADLNLLPATSKPNTIIDAAPKDSKNKKHKSQADFNKYPLPSRLRRGTSQQDIDTSMLDLDLHSQGASGASEPSVSAHRGNRLQ